MGFGVGGSGYSIHNVYIYILLIWAYIYIIYTSVFKKLYFPQTQNLLISQVHHQQSEDLWQTGAKAIEVIYEWIYWLMKLYFENLVAMSQFIWDSQANGRFLWAPSGWSICIPKTSLVLRAKFGHQNAWKIGYEATETIRTLTISDTNSWIEIEKN